MTYKVIIVVLLLFRTTYGYSQTATGTEMQELVKIAELYKNAPSLSFAMYFSYADSLDPQEALDSALIFTRMSYGKTFLFTEEFEMLLGKEYTVYVDKTDSLILTSPANDQKNIFQVPLLDPVFRQAHITGMKTLNVNDTTRELSVQFKPESNFLKYKITYDPNTGLIYTIEFSVRNQGGAHDIPVDHIMCATVSMLYYTMDPLDPAMFNENRYFYKLNGNLYLQEAWAQYHLQN